MHAIKISFKKRGHNFEGKWEEVYGGLGGKNWKEEILLSNYNLKN